MPKRQDQGGWPDTGFSKRLKELRQLVGLTQEELANRAGCNKFTVAKLEAGKQVPAWPLVLALAEALGQDCTALMSDEARLSALLLRWEELAEQGKQVDLDEFCHGNADLRTALQNRIGVLSAPTPSELRPTDVSAAPVLQPINEEHQALSKRSPDLTSLIGMSNQGNDQARSALLNHAQERLRRRASQMLQSYPVLDRSVEIDDLIQEALMRLTESLKCVQFESARHFLSLATVELRRALLDLVERSRPVPSTERPTRTNDTRPDLLEPPPPSGAKPASPDDWERFYYAVAALPPEEQDVFGLIWHQGLALDQAARFLNVSLRTIKRRWQSARILVAKMLQGNTPQT
jgi:RNA polymerase sigma factor (sigma-70 family)